MENTKGFLFWTLIWVFGGPIATAAGQAVAEPDLFSPDSLTRLTIEAFVFPRATNQQRILSRYGHATNLMRGWEWQQVGHTFTFRFNQAAEGETGIGLDTAVSVENAMVAGRWVYLATTFDAHAGKVQIFVDGIKMLSRDIRNLPLRSSSILPLCIGRYGQSALHPFDGLQDELRLSAEVREPSGIPNVPFSATSSTLLLCHFDKVESGRLPLDNFDCAGAPGLRFIDPADWVRLVPSRAGFGLALDLKP